MRAVITAVILFGVVAALIAQPTSGQDGADERLSDLETRVAELEAAVFAGTTPTSPPDPATAADPTSQRTIGGNALDLLLAGESGEVVLIATGPLERGQIPLAIRNNTDTAVAGTTVKVEAKDASGVLIAVGETTGGQILKPYLLQPGEVAIGFASLQGDVPSDATFAFAVDAEEAPGLMGDFIVDLEMQEATWRSDRIVGVARNPAEETVGGTYMNVVCFASDGTPTRAEPATIQEDIEPEATATFQIDGAYVADCERFLVAATAHPEP